MAGTYPTTPEPARIDVDSHQPTVVDVAESGKSQTRIVGGHLWKLKFQYDQMLRSQFSPIYAFAMKQRGRFDSFTTIAHHLRTPQGVGTGTPQTAGAAITAGDTAIPTDGWTASQTGILKAGDILKFANHTKVYMVTDDADSDAGGAATLNIMPPLTEDVPDNNAITITDVPFTVRFDDDILQWKAQAPSLSAYTVKMIEHLI